MVPGSPVTFAYKTVGDCEIRADVFVPAAAAPHSVIVWIHGGALIMGRRTDLSHAHRQAYLAAGHAVVSIDYRLAPETKLPAIVEDVQDAFAWVRERGPELFGADASRVAAVGHSAGGYLALMAGVRVEPPLQALVSFYGYGDIVGDWYSRPDPFYCRQPRVSEEEARRTVGQSCTSGEGDGGRELFYLYCRQQGLWPREVGGRDPRSAPSFFANFCPVQHVTPRYPPTLLLHGDADTDVPYEQSVMMAAALARAGVEHDLITVRGGGHGFDQADDPAVVAAFDRVLAFLSAHLCAS